jgi:hypothetical protein
MRLQARQLEVAVHAGRRDLGLGCYGADAPVRGAIAGLVCSVVLISSATRSSWIVRGLPGATRRADR